VSASSATATRPSDERRRIALVEDDLRTSRTLTLLLEDEGFEIRAFTDARAALDALRRERFDILVTDHVLPGMQGLDLVQLLRREQPSLRCVVVSGYDAPKTAKDAEIPWLLKPVDFEALLAAFDEAWRR
jgi:DNA-binding NtrC family response regulator